MSDPAHLEGVYRQHSERARTLSELVSKLVLRRRGQLPKSFDELMQDYDIIRRCHEHVGSCQAMNELRAAAWPDQPVPPAPASPL
jgi:hypothetical protein